MTHTIQPGGVVPPIKMHHIELPMEQPYGNEVRIGLIALSTDLVIERDFTQMVPTDEIGVFTTRIWVDSPNSEQSFLALKNRLEDAARMIIPDSRVDVMVFGCTSASTVIGPENVQAQIQLARPGIACTNPATATLAAMNALEAKNIALITPYPEKMTESVVQFLLNGGLNITSVRALGYDTDEMTCSIPAQEFIRAAQDSVLDGADAIFLSCTATKALNIIEELEELTGLPVICSNQATFWHSLRLAGWNKPVYGYGQLLSKVMVDAKHV